MIKFLRQLISYRPIICCRIIPLCHKSSKPMHAHTNMPNVPVYEDDYAVEKDSTSSRSGKRKQYMHSIYRIHVPSSTLAHIDRGYENDLSILRQMCVSVLLYLGGKLDPNKNRLIIKHNKKSKHQHQAISHLDIQNATVFHIDKWCSTGILLFITISINFIAIRMVFANADRVQHI